MKMKEFGTVTVIRKSLKFNEHRDLFFFYPPGDIPYLDNVDECHTVYIKEKDEPTQIS